MGVYSVLDTTVTPILSSIIDGDVLVKDPRQKFVWRRRMDAWKFGSGGDYKFPDTNEED